MIISFSTSLFPSFEHLVPFLHFDSQDFLQSDFSEQFSSPLEQSLLISVLQPTRPCPRPHEL